MKDWDTVKCTQCQSFKKCRNVSAMKGSAYCQTRKGYIPSYEERHPNASFNFFGFLSGLATHLSPKQLFAKRKQEEEEDNT